MSQTIARRRTTRLAAVAASAAMSLGVAAGPALAHPEQNGLVNVNVSGNQIAVPVAVAANICGVSVNLLAVDLGPDGSATCTIDGITQTVTQNRGGGRP